MKKRKRKPLMTDESRLDQLALWITERVGTMFFFMAILIWTSGWLFWNMFAPEHLRFDPFPAFVLWLFISNMIQLFLMPLIMIGQNLQGREADERAESDYEINRKAEIEIQEIKAKLDTIMHHLGVKSSHEEKKIAGIKP